MVFYATKNMIFFCNMEWYGAFSLTVTLVWLYLEILRLLAVLAGRD